MSIALVVFPTPYDNLLRECMDTVWNLRGPISERWMFDNSGDESRRERLSSWYPVYRHRGVGPRQSRGSALNYAWSCLRTSSRARWVLHYPTIGIINRRVDLNAMIGAMVDSPWLAQMNLRSGPDPILGQQCHDRRRARTWLEYDGEFSTGPCLYRMSLTQLSWQDSDRPEEEFTTRLRGNALATENHLGLGCWGNREDEPVIRVGVQAELSRAENS